MAQDQPIAPFDWFANQFTLENRQDFIAQISSYMSPLFEPGDRVLDLCCGTGPVAFYLEERGARVTAIDLAPTLIDMAHEEATRRGSQVEFIRASVLTHPLGNEEYDLAVCFGNAISDFPPQSLNQFRDRLSQALKPGGRFVLEHKDGLLRMAAMSEPRDVIEQGVDSQVARCFQEYDPAMGAFKIEYRHLASGEVYDAVGYVYTGPLIRIVLEPRFELERSIQLEDDFVVDVYVKR